MRNTNDLCSESLNIDWAGICDFRFKYRKLLFIPECKKFELLVGGQYMLTLEKLTNLTNSFKLGK